MSQLAGAIGHASLEHNKNKIERIYVLTEDFLSAPGRTRAKADEDVQNRKKRWRRSSDDHGGFNS
jgi:hypothetical protein